MKSPREILLQHHAKIEPELDRLREEALAKCLPEAEHELKVATPPANWGSELFGALFSLRWHLAGLSAAWICISILHFGAAGPAPATYTHLSKPSVEQFVLAIKQNRRLVEEIFEANPEPPKPRSLGLPSRSERRLSVFIVYNLNYERNNSLLNRYA